MRKHPVRTHEARILRQVQSPAEETLWHHLRARRFRGLKFRRQVPVGPWTVSFVCAEHRLILDLDHHPDPARDAQFIEAGYRILHLQGDAVLSDLDAVLDRISGAISQ